MIDPHALRTLIEQLVTDWEAHNAQEEDDEFGRERYSKMEDCIADVRAVLSALPETQWQPMETAPKDGTPILGWSGYSYEVTQWSQAAEQWLICDGEHGFDLTHWMPLPASPSSPEEPDK
jgi:hypothetical protein